jgi:hypothetical protein
MAYPAALTLQRADGVPCNRARFYEVPSAGDIHGCGFAGGEQPLILSHTNHLSEISFVVLNHCMQLSLSTRVDGYMRGAGQSVLGAGFQGQQQEYRFGGSIDYSQWLLGSGSRVCIKVY